MAQVLLTKSHVEKVICPLDASKLVIFDLGCRGLILEVRPSGLKVYGLRYLDTHKKQRQVKLGDSRDLTLDQARQQADKIRNRLALGEDIKQTAQDLRHAPTVSQFIHETYKPFVQGYKRSWRCDLSLLKNHVEPVWGKKYLDQVTKADVVCLFSGHRKGYSPASCNRLLVLISFMFTLALRWETPGLKTNPAKDHPLFKEQNQRERFLSEPDAQALFAAIKQSNNPMLQHIIPMLILTGARKREVLDARWKDIDLVQKSWRIHTTKNGQPRHVPLSDGAIAVLDAIPRNGEWIFANEDTGKPYASTYVSWHTARTRAGLADVRVHELRHSFASFLVNAGRSIYEVQRLLGHAHIRTTQRYAHLSKDTLLDATNAVNSAVGHVFMPVLASSPAVQLQLAQ